MQAQRRVQEAKYAEKVLYAAAVENGLVCLCCFEVPCGRAHATPGWYRPAAPLAAAGAGGALQLLVVSEPVEVVGQCMPCSFAGAHHWLLEVALDVSPEMEVSCAVKPAAAAASVGCWCMQALLLLSDWLHKLYCEGAYWPGLWQHCM
jgi:hypothetical protein